MKYVCLVVILLIVLISSYSQNFNATNKYSPSNKPPLTIESFDKWLSINEDAFLSKDGRYVIYSINEGDKPFATVVQDLNSEWKVKISAIVKCEFSSDSRLAVCLTTNDTLNIITLGSKSFNEKVANIASFQIFSQNKTDYLAYLSKEPYPKLIVRNLSTTSEYSIENISEYLINKNGNNLLVRINEKKDNSDFQTIVLFNTSNWSKKIIWQGNKTSNFIFDRSGGQLVFLSEDSVDNKSKKTLWYFNSNNLQNAVPILNSNCSIGINDNMEFSSIEGFSKDSNKIFIWLKEKKVTKLNPNVVKLDVWNYRDSKLQSQQLNELMNREAQNYLSIIGIADKRIIQLQYPNFYLSNFSSATLSNDSCIYMDYKEGDDFEDYWNCLAKSKSYLINTNNGEKIPLGINFKNQSFSPGGNYLIGLDEGFKDIYSYEIKTKIIHNLTKSLPIQVEDMVNKNILDRPYYKSSRNLFFSGWLANDKALLVCDDFDIWQIDPSGKKAPINLTNGYGRKNKIIFRIIDLADQIFSDFQTVYVSAFNLTNKNSGYYKITLGNSQTPELLTMGQFVYNRAGLSHSYRTDTKLSTYLVLRESTQESPNFFFTKNFKNFIHVSNICPEKNYNWLTSELHHFKTLSGKIEQGILYKPENFNAQKKYPVIIHFYERKSQELNKFHSLDDPEGGHGELDIAWFVSNGYLVFTPDIHYKIGEPGPSAFNSIVGAANYISRFSWIDSKHIGIQGHSFGAYEANYTIAHTNKFAAAVSSSGITDLFSRYWCNDGDTRSPYVVEMWQYRMGNTPWQIRDLYFKNSPIFNANKISTPVLLIANKLDRNVPFTQGVELFTALRRLGKKAWLIQYDGQRHGLSDKNYYKDYIIRMTQFFDHYLKYKAPPQWMIYGIPAKEKGFEMGLNLGNTNELKKVVSPE